MNLQLTFLPNYPPLLTTDDFTALQLWGFLIDGELEWESVTEASQKRLIDSQLVDEDGNILPRYKLIDYPFTFLSGTAP